MTFLDDRVRELEGGARTSAAEVQRLKQYIIDVRGKHKSKAKVCNIHVGRPHAVLLVIDEVTIESGLPDINRALGTVVILYLFFL